MGGNSSRSVITDGQCVVHSSTSDKVTVTAPSSTPIIFNAQQLLPVLSSNDEDSEHYTWDFFDINGVEHNDHGGYVPEGETNIDRSNITKDFMFRSSAANNNKITIYPIYWCSNQAHTLGIYYFWETDENGDPITGGMNKDGRTSDTDLIISTDTNDPDYDTKSRKKYLHRIPIFIDREYDLSSNLIPDNGQVYIENRSPVTKDGEYNHGLNITNFKNWDALTTLINNTNGISSVEDLFIYDATETSFPTGFDEDKIAALNETFESLYPNKKSVLPAECGAHGVSVSYKWNEPLDWYWCSFSITIAEIDETTHWINVPNNAQGWFSLDGKAAYNFTQPAAVKSLGINVTVPDGLNVGMYIDCQYGTLYSQSSRNSITGLNGTTCHAATFKNTVNDRQFFCFEDWMDETQSDADLNDIVFVVQGATPVTTSTIIEEEKQQDEQFQWIIAAEDLGTTDDFDFNDIVVGISTLSEVYGSTPYTRLNLTALAAGGTLDLYLHLNPGSNKKIYGDISSDGTYTLLPHGVTDVANAEWHKWFGNYSKSTMINTEATGGAWSTTRSSCQVLIEGSFSISEYSLAEDNGNIQGFYITVEGCDLANIDPTGETSWTLKGKSSEGAAPQMFLILDKGNETGTTGWKWPKERGHIRDAYDSDKTTSGPSFSDWASNGHNDLYKTWHQYPTGTVIDRSKIGTSQTITTDYEWSDFDGS